MSKATVYRRVIQIVAIFDTVIAICYILYASYQFSHGEDLIPGGLKRGEKISRLAVYAVLNYIFLAIQLVMAVTLLYSATRVLRHPSIHIMQIFARWRAWSCVYLLFIIIDLFVVVILMEDNNRRSVTITLLVVHIVFRPIGIILIRQFEQVCLILYDTSNTVIQLPRMNNNSNSNSNPA